MRNKLVRPLAQRVYLSDIDKTTANTVTRDHAGSEFGTQLIGSISTH